MKRFVLSIVASAMFLFSSAASAADVTQHQWVQRDGSGSITGRVVIPRGNGISALRDANVKLIDANGRLASAAVKSDKTGRFNLTSVAPGIYTLMIQGDQAFACCAMHVVDADVRIGTSFEIAAGAVDYSVVKGAMIRYAPVDNMPPIDFDPASNPWQTDRALSGEQLRIVQSDGGLKGRITRAGFGTNLAAPSTNVIIYRDGNEVARTMTDASGNFNVSDLPAGSYSVLGTGEYGFGFLGLELIDSLTVQSVDNSADAAGSLVAKQNGVQDTFVMQIAPLPGAINIIEDKLIEEREISSIPLDMGPGQIVDGGFSGVSGGGVVSGGGGFSGGGGGISGGGGLGGIGGIGGLGGVLALALSDDDNAVVIPAPASPATP